MLGAMGISSAMVLILGIFPLPVMRAVTSALSLDGEFVMQAEALAWAGSGSLSLFNPLLLLVLVAVVGCALYLCTRNIWEEKPVTWNCGTYPTERQQYSATGFSKPVRRAFDYLLKPKREVSYMRKDHAYFGRQLSYKLQIPDMITEKLYLPLQKRFVGASALLRRLQQGSVRLYVSYVMAAMVLVLVWGALYK